MQLSKTKSGPFWPPWLISFNRSGDEGRDIRLIAFKGADEGGKRITRRSLRSPVGNASNLQYGVDRVRQGAEIL